MSINSVIGMKVLLRNRPKLERRIAPNIARGNTSDTSNRMIIKMRTRKRKISLFCEITTLLCVNGI